MKKALLLNYHLIDNKLYEFDHFGGIYAVEQAMFEQQMAFLYQSAIRVATISEILDGKVEDDFCVALSFDDGNPSDYETVYPILKQYNFRANFFLSIQNMGQNGVEWQHYREMYDAGFEIGSHGLTHCELTTVSTDVAFDELSRSKQIIEQQLGIKVNYFSLPYGRYNQKLIHLAQKSGYKAIISTHFKLVKPSNAPFVLDRWSIKRNTLFVDFKNITSNNRKYIMKHQLVSSFKKKVIAGIGTNFTNKIYTLKNKYFGK